MRDAHLCDCLTGDELFLLLADLIIHSRGAGSILLPGQEPEDSNEAKDIEN